MKRRNNRRNNNTSNHSPLSEKWLRKLFIKMDVFIDEQQETNQEQRKMNHKLDKYIDMQTEFNSTMLKISDTIIQTNRATLDTLSMMHETQTKQWDKLINVLNVIAKKLS